MTAPGQPAFFPAYRPRASALHSTRAAIGAAFCVSLALVFVLFEHPLVLAAGLAAVSLAGWGAGAASDLGRAARLGAAVAVLVAVINPLVSNEGATVLVRGWTVLAHRFDITLEAVVYGAIAGVRLLGLILACALFSSTVDPDELLRSARRVSPRSALTVALATRLVPVLARDASRRGEAARCRARPAGRLRELARAALAGSLERAVEVAAALEVRGYALSGRRARRDGRAWARGGRLSVPGRRLTGRVLSRHDLRVGASAAGIAVAAVAGAALGAAPFSAYPSLIGHVGPSELALVAVILCLAVAPFAGRSARLGVAGTAAGGDFDG